MLRTIKVKPADLMLDPNNPRLVSNLSGSQKIEDKDVEKLQNKLEKARKDVYGNLNAYQKVRLSRHFERPQLEDYINHLITDFTELHGDRLFGDDPAIISGIGRFAGKPVVLVGHQRGRGVQERIKRNFGMPQPEGYRKALRLFKLAEKFKMPLLLFVDTQGAYPGLEAEARGQAEAIARNLYVLAGSKTQIITVVIGEGGSGGALALSVCDRLLMLENSTYSVITPEGCASILWGKKDAENVGAYAEVAADSLQVTAQALLKNGIIDEIIPEPPGCGHRDRQKATEAVGVAIAKNLSELIQIDMSELIEKRYQKFRSIGNPE